ncbi:hypothetical protein AX16_007747 [Volvariella volvacea WC 439]|nr:hypothetical protein AX16_007747 [Volvariella volvacea WC 439]
MSVYISFAAWRGVSVTFHILAMLITTWRIIHRRKTRGLWWDDYWALFALILDIVYFSTVWIRTNPYGPPIDQQDGVILFWMTAILFPSVVWAARASIAWSIIRFVPRQTSQRTRRALYCLLCLFFLFWVALLLHKVVVCASDSEWHNNRAIQCYLGSSVGIITLVTDVIGDAGLLFSAIFVFYRGQLHSGQRLLILSILTSSIFSLLAGITYAVFVFRASTFGQSRAILISLTANLKSTITLIACNLFVIVIYFYKLRGNEEDMETPMPSIATQETTSKISHESGSLPELKSAA